MLQQKTSILFITGTPGTGKTLLARALTKKLHGKMVNEKAFCKQMKCSTWNAKEKEWEIDLKQYKKAFSAFAKEHFRAHPNQTLILEGHVGCEVSLPVSRAVLLRCDSTELGYRLAKRKYSELKIQENIFCEEVNYCGKQLRTHYSGKKILSLRTDAGTTAQHVKKVQQWMKK